VTKQPEIPAPPTIEAQILLLAEIRRSKYVAFEMRPVVEAAQAAGYRLVPPVPKSADGPPTTCGSTTSATASRKAWHPST
jgi:hypothetical protein